MKLRLSLFLALLTGLIALPAFALDLHTARSTGQIGEKPDGYVQALVAAPDVKALADEVNAKRRAEYARIAQTKGQPAEIVAKVAAQEIINRLEPGAKYQTPGGEWKKR